MSRAGNSGEVSLTRALPNLVFCPGHHSQGEVLHPPDTIRRTKFMRGFAVTLGLLFTFVTFGHAHDPGLSAVQLTAAGPVLQLHVAYAPADADAIIAAAGQQRPEGDEARSRALGTLAPRLARITAGEVDLVPTDVTAHWIPDTRAVELRISYDATTFDSISLTYHADALTLLPPGHRQLATLGAGLSAAETDTLLDVDHRLVSFTPAIPSVASTASGENPSSRAAPVGIRFAPFFALGVEHILTGYDHLVFLLGLVVVCVRLRQVLLIVSSFTVAHSITLGLAAFDVVRVSSSLVEPLIAASIVFVGVENLLARRPTSGRPWITFAFGLVHGFGFASVLHETLGRVRGVDGIVPLLGFNLGVEVGQIAVAASALALLAVARRRGVSERTLVPVTSVFVVLLGAYWFVSRVIPA